MPDFLSSTTVQAGLGLLILAILVTAATYVLASYRDYTAEDQFEPADVLANLEEMHLKGDISDEEFRTIKARTHQHLEGSCANDDSSDVDESSPDTQE